jgi:hypothetical protein
MNTLTYAQVLDKTMCCFQDILIGFFHSLKVSLDVEFSKLMLSLWEVQWIYLLLRIDLDALEYKIKLEGKIIILEARLAASMGMATQLIQATIQLEQ